MRIKVKDFSLIIELVVTLFCFVGITWAFTAGIVGIAFSILLLLLIFGFSVYKCNAKMELTSVLTLPLMLSAFQNVYLGAFSLQLSSTSIQILTILNFLYAGIVFVILFIREHKQIQRDNLFAAFLLLIIYSIASVVFLSSINIISIMSSIRNIISVFLFFFIGVMSSKYLKIDRFERVLLFITLIVVLVGLYEVFVDRSMWVSLHISDLWTKKGIRIQPSGLPTNFYSSERLHGERIRRMTSTFADPVNLGAFLFVGFCISWFKRNKLLVLLVLAAIILTVSKGAFLGILIFVSVYAYYYSSRPVFLGILGGAGLIGILFLVYAMRTSANSVFLHMSGLTAAFRNLLSHPLGSGVGSNGVLARQFSGFSANAAITETGLGMIIGQLGIVGLFVYTYFFFTIYRVSLKLENKREVVLCLSLVLSVIANIFFNEVALSPNSCAAYFLIVGYYVSTVWRLRKARDNALFTSKV